MVLLIVFAILMAFIIVSVRVSAAKEEKRLRGELEEKKRRFPRAYGEYVGKNKSDVQSANIAKLRKILSEDWAEAERRLSMDEQREREAERKREEEQRKAAEEARRKEEEQRKAAEEARRKEEERERQEQEARKVEAGKNPKERLVTHVRGTNAQYKAEKDEIERVLRNNGINCLYHFTSARNIDSIQRLGGLYSWYTMKQRGYEIPVPGGDGLSRQLDRRHGLEDYVRLSFCNNHPMAFKLKMAGQELVLLEIDPIVATWKDTLFSDINAADSNHQHGGRLSDLRRVHFDAVKRNYVSRDDIDFKPHQAEVMVKTFIPIKYIKILDIPF